MQTYNVNVEALLASCAVCKPRGVMFSGCMACSHLVNVTVWLKPELVQIVLLPSCLVFLPHGALCHAHGTSLSRDAGRGD